MSRLYRVLLVLFFLSGASGLIYEVVWLRMLIRSFGVTVYAVSTVLAVFMGGLAAGALWGGQRAAKFHRPVRTYGWIEVLIGLCAIASTGAMHLLPSFVAWMGEFVSGGAVELMIQFVLVGVCLLPPTFLMGATLPVLSALVPDPSKAGRGVGLLYGVNTCGAVLGVIVSGFLLLGTVGEWRTVLGGAVVNFIVGLRALTITIPGGAVPSQAGSVLPSDEGARVPSGLFAWIAALTGMSALFFQVIWARILVSVVGNSVYGFSSMLAAYLAGIAGGAILASAALARRRLSLWLMLCQMIMALGAIWSLYAMTWIGVSEPDPRYLYSRIWQLKDFLLLPLYALFVVVPVTVASGAVFPLVTGLACQTEGVISRVVGRLYAANTWGAIVGSLLAGFLLIPALGTVSTLLVAAFVCCGTAVLSLRAVPRTPRWYWAVIAMVIGLISFSGGGLYDPVLRVMEGRLAANTKLLFHAEDVSAHVSAVRRPDRGTIQIYLNGVLVSGTGKDIGVLFVHFPISFHPDPRSALIVGLGAGEAVVAALNQGIDVTVVELVPAVKETLPFTQPAHRSLLDEGARIVFADGRNYILKSRETHDYILVDVSPPIFSSGSVNLYTMDFLSLAKRRLTEDGILALWVPTPCFESDFWSIASGFRKAFRHVMVWGQLGTSGALLMGTDGDRTRFDMEESELRDRLRARGVLEALIPILTTNRLLADGDVRAYASFFRPVTDDRPTTEFPLFRFARGEKFWFTNKFLSRAVEYSMRRRTDGATKAGAAEALQ